MQIIILCLIAAVSCAKFKSKPKKDPYADFANDPDLEIPEEDEDKPPSDFKGDVQGAKISNFENRNHGKGKFRYT